LEDLVLAYIDPGAGSLALQLLLAGAAGLAILARTYARRIRGWFSKRKPAAPSPNSEK